MHQTLTSNDQLTRLAKSYGIHHWEDLIAYVQKLPFGRNKNRTDFSLVLLENKGSCSAKHGLLKTLADSNNIAGVNLYLGIYKMNQLNTPGIGEVLTKHGVEYIPEAHCYLKINNKGLDVTSYQSDFNRISDDIIEEHKIKPEQVCSYKINYHKTWLKNWIIDHNQAMSFQQLWEIREQCITQLAS